MILKILAGLIVLIAVLLVVIALRPSEFRTARRIVIAAPPATVFAQVNDLHKWAAWSPWAKLDPSSTATFAGPETGLGSSMTWSGNDKVGEGTMTIVESRPNELLLLELEFRKPFAGTNEAEFTFRPEAGGTAVEWAMSGKNNFMFKAVGLFMDCDKMLGAQFEQGLASLKAVSEAAAKP